MLLFLTGAFFRQSVAGHLLCRYCDNATANYIASPADEAMYSEPC